MPLALFKLASAVYASADRGRGFSHGNGRLAFASVGLGALGLTALIVVAMGTYRPGKTTLIQEVKTLGHKMPAGYDDKTFR